MPDNVRLAVRTPPCTHGGLGSFHFARRYFGNRKFSFFSSGYLDVSVHRVPSAYLWIQYTVHEDCSCGFPHSEICGSWDICSLPQLIAAYHVFHRLSVPRHPPCALVRLTWFSSLLRVGWLFIHSVVCQVLFKCCICIIYNQNWFIFKSVWLPRMS